jgi:large subunit ribosomal protein L33
MHYREKRSGVMAAKNKKNKIRLNSTGVKEDGTRTGFFYVTNKNPKSGKLTKMKYDPVIRKHVQFVEGKIK